ncbi:amino acid ABC transporter permease [Microbacterium sp. ZW T5_56]|uniref:amino acid ABC transporter permease n=1 Tax=Microbacterium sp. ZW T5_56 TaxID=3378081 RepID=UPI0038524CC1
MTADMLIPDRPVPRPRARRTSPTAFMYDAPGPRGRRRIVIGSIISAAAILALVVLMLIQFGANGQLAAERWTPFTDVRIWGYLLVGLGGTLQAAAIVAVLGSVLGLLLALGRVSNRRWLRTICRVYTEVARTLPALLLIYLMMFGLPQLGLNLPTLWKLVVPLTISNAAVFAEVVRAGILSLPRGQTEAALSLGLRPWQVQSRVVLPQALRNVSPALVTQFVSLMKDTSLGYVVAFTELLYRGQVLASYLHLLIPTYVAVTVIYLAVNGALTGVAALLQQRLDRKRAGSAR